MTTSIKGHYEVREILYGKDYIWMPRKEEVDDGLADSLIHPWRKEYERWLEEQMYPEQAEWAEIRQLH